MQCWFNVLYVSFWAEKFFGLKTYGLNLNVQTHYIPVPCQSLKYLGFKCLIFEIVQEVSMKPATKVTIELIQFALVWTELAF